MSKDPAEEVLRYVKLAANELREAQEIMEQQTEPITPEERAQLEANLTETIESLDRLKAKLGLG